MARPIRLYCLQVISDNQGLELAIPPPALCTDNGVMVAWAGIERMRLGLWEHLLAPADEVEWVDVRPRWPLTDRCDINLYCLQHLPSFSRTESCFSRCIQVLLLYRQQQQLSLARAKTTDIMTC